MKLFFSQYQLEIILFILFFYSISSIIMGWYKLSPKPLYKHPFFWASTLLPIIMFFVLSYFDISRQKTSPDAELNNYDISTLSISVLALIIPIISILSSIHRSIQTDEQIRVTEKKNESDKYYAHQKYIVESLNSLTKHEVKSSWNGKENIKLISISNPHKLYRLAFNEASPDKLSIRLNNTIETKLIEFWCWLNDEVCQIIKRNSPGISASFIHRTEENLVKLSRDLGLSRPYGSYSANIKLQHSELTTSFLNEEDFIKTINSYNELTSEICDILNINFDASKNHPDVNNYINMRTIKLQCFNQNFLSLIQHQKSSFH